jgi:hypothetical protein
MDKQEDGPDPLNLAPLQIIDGPVKSPNFLLMGMMYLNIGNH